MTDLNNPLRYSIGDWKVNLPDGIRVTSIEMNPSEANIYIHWEAVDE